MMPVSDTESLAMIASALALPIVDAHIQDIEQHRPIGNVNWDDVANGKLDTEVAPWLARRRELIDTIRGTPNRTSTNKKFVVE